jgi:hypothetical protein
MVTTTASLHGVGAVESSGTHAGRSGNLPEISLSQFSRR